MNSPETPPTPRERGADVSRQIRTEDAGSFRESLRQLLEEPESSKAAQIVHYLMIVVIIGSTASTVVETMPEMRTVEFFFQLEMGITAFFTIEIACRLYSCESLRTFATNAFNIVDFLAVFPGYVEIIMMVWGKILTNEMNKAVDSMRTLRMIRMLRLVRVIRVMRLAKVARHSQTLNVVLAVLTKVWRQGLLVMMMFMGFIMVLLASLIYLCEQSEMEQRCEMADMAAVEFAGVCYKNGSFSSIPASFWWAIITLTTVGYGDMVPKTIQGKIVGGISAVSGVVVIAVGVAMISANFRDSYREERAKAKFKRRARHTSMEVQRDCDEIEEALADFQARSTKLLTKLAEAATAAPTDGTSKSQPVALSMLTIIQENSTAVQSELYSYVYESLLEALHQKTGS